MNQDTMAIIGQLALQGGILMFCAFVQSAVVFAFSLFSNALLLLLGGFALPEVVMLSILGSTRQRLLMISRMHAHDWSNGKMRVTLSAITTLMVPFQLVIMVATFGWGALPSIPQALMLVPAVALGTAFAKPVPRAAVAPRLRPFFFL